MLNLINKQSKFLWSKLSIKTKILIYLIVTLIICGLFMAISFYQGAWYLKQFENQTTLYYEINNYKENFKKASDYLEQYVGHDDKESLVLYYKTQVIMEQQVVDLRKDVKEVSMESDLLSRAISNATENYIKRVKKIVPNSKNVTMYRLYYNDIIKIESYILLYCDQLLNECLNSGQNFYIKMQVQLEYFKKLVVALLFVFVIVLGVTFSRMLDKNILKPIHLLSNDAIEISRGNLDNPEIITQNDDEIKYLAKVFFSMKQSMKEELSILHEKQEITEKLHEQELNMVTMQNLLIQEKSLQLQAQVKPHFLYNALNTIARTARLEEANNTENLILSLSKLFRYIMNTENSMVPLQREIDIVNNFMFIQKSRFGDRIELEWRISKEVDIGKILVPSFVLQPMVENAISHGLSLKIEGGFIRIRIHKCKDILIILIGDNGVGMEKEKLQTVRRYEAKESTSGNGIGIANVAKRIELLGESSFQIQSKSNVGTVVKIRLNTKVLDAYV